jgi:hypothetical protein
MKCLKKFPVMCLVKSSFLYLPYFGRNRGINGVYFQGQLRFDPCSLITVKAEKADVFNRMISAQRPRLMMIKLQMALSATFHTAMLVSLGHLSFNLRKNISVGFLWKAGWSFIRRCMIGPDSDHPFQYVR